MSELLVFFRFYWYLKLGYGRYIMEGLLSLFSRCHARVCGHPVQVATHVHVSDLLYVMLFNVTRSIFVGYKCQLYHVWISVKFTVWV